MVTIFYFIVFLLSLILMGSFFFKNKKVDTFFVLFGILIMVNCLGRYMLASAENLEMAIWANKFMYVGGCFAPLMTVMVLTKLCNLKMPRILTIGLTLYSSLVLALVMTIGKMPIYYQHVELGYGKGYNYLIKSYGPTHFLYPLMMAIYAIVLILYIGIALKNRRKISFRLVFVIGTVAFSIVLLYFIERIIKTDVSFLSVGYLIGIAFMIRYFERVNMFDMAANISGILDRMNDYGYISLDDKYRYVNANAYMKAVFPEIDTWLVDKEVPSTNTYLYEEVVKELKEWDGEAESSKFINVENAYYEINFRNIIYGRKKIGFLVEMVDRTLEKKYYNAIEAYNAVMEKEVEEKSVELQSQENKIRHLFVQTVTALSGAVDAKDRYTSGHSKRVAEYARMLAQRMGKSKEEQDEIYRAGLLHDVGKIRIPAEIINKPGKLTDEEYNIIKIHPVTGYHILRGISDGDTIAVAAKYHHERYDGKGYPNGLSGDKIPEVARILGVADAYDAMASNRSYRNALPQDVVRSEIEKGKGTQFDPYIADVMLGMIDEDREYELKQTDSMQRRILTVDDESMNNKIIAHIMQDEPMYEVVPAGGGKEALEILDRQEFDLILLDVKMPEMDGLETLKRIREKYMIPVVLMTGDKNLDISAGFTDYGCDDYITKPFLPMLVKEIVHNMTERTEVAD